MLSPSIAHALAYFHKRRGIALGQPRASCYGEYKEGFGRPKPDLFLPPQLTPPRWAFLSKEAQ